MAKMKAAILKDTNLFEIVEIDKPVIEAPDDIIIKVLVCSICGTDVNMSKKPDSPTYGDMRGKVLGHELVGEVVEIGSEVSGFKPGDRVVVNPNSYCTICENCRNGYHNHCKNMQLMGLTVQGAFAEYVKTQERLTFHISDKVPLEYAAFAEPLSCAMNGFSRLDITPGQTCVVFGCGPIGLLFAQLARRKGARVVCVEPMEKRLSVARKLGFETITPCADLKDKLVALWGRRANVCIDAAGGQLPVAIDVAEYCGNILCFASPRVVKEANLGPIQGKELTIKGSFIIHDSMPKAITLLENDYLDLKPLITHHMPLEKLNKGMEYLKSGDGMEIILNIGI